MIKTTIRFQHSIIIPEVPAAVGYRYRVGYMLAGGGEAVNGPETDVPSTMEFPHNEFTVEVPEKAQVVVQLVSVDDKGQVSQAVAMRFVAEATVRPLPPGPIPPMVIVKAVSTSLPVVVGDDKHPAAASA